MRPRIERSRRDSSLHLRVREHGYVRVPGVLSTGEIQRLGAFVTASLATRPWVECDTGRHLPNAAAECPELAWVFAHPGVLEAVRGALGHPDVMFTGNCDLHCDKLGNWHTDMGHGSGGYLDGSSQDSAAFGLVKVGLYLQDHHLDRRGFFVRDGSHRAGGAEPAPPTYVPTMSGDVLLFDPRLTHCGIRPDLVERLIWRVARRPGPGEFTSRFGRHARSLYWKLRGRPGKRAIFFTYGARHAITEAFARGIAAGYAPEAKRLAPEMVALLAQSGVTTCSIP